MIIETGSLRMTRPEDIGFLFRLVDFLPYTGIILMIASVVILYKDYRERRGITLEH